MMKRPLEQRLQKSGTTAVSATIRFTKTHRSGFTIFEIILAMAVLALIAGAIYAISMAAMEATQETLKEELTIRRLDGFLRITRNAFLNLPAHGAIYLDSSNNDIPDLYFENASNLFGLPSLGGGTLVLSARARPDGTRTLAILRLPKNIQGSDRDRFYQEGHWTNLLPQVVKPHWSFFRNGDWVDEWPQGAGRPQLVRLEMTLRAIPYPIVAIFYLPPISRVSAILEDLLNRLRLQRENAQRQGGQGADSPPLPSSPPPSQQR
jgi:prepilin-type N-terminal cleavage/methylation domain-containing protein